MTLARRLLFASSGGGGRFARTAQAFEILAAPIGAWPSWTSAFYNATTGSSLFGVVSSTGSVRVGEYVHATGGGSSVEVGVLSGDQHNSPSVIQRSSDGRYVALMSDHSGTQMYVNISTNPNDNSAWAGTSQLDDELGGTAYTYPFLAQLGDEANDPIYLIFRDVVGANSQWCYSKSTSGGADGSWAARTVLVSGVNYYLRAAKSSESRIDFAVTDGTRADQFASMYHFYYDGAFRKSDGTSLGSPPFTVSNLTKVYDGATNGARIPNSIQRVGSEIAIAFPVYTGTVTGAIAEDGDYKVARWNGSAWSIETLAASVGMTTVDFSEGGVSLDPANLDRAAASVRAAGTWRMHLYTRAGGVWSGTQVTSSGAEDRYPWWVLDHTTELEFIWQKGTFTTEDIFDVGVWGYGLTP